MFIVYDLSKSTILRDLPCATMNSMKTVIVYDPTARDGQSKVRGIGRYLQSLKETFVNTTKEEAQTINAGAGYQITPEHPVTLYFKFVDDPKLIQKDSIFIQPFFNPIQKPVFWGKKARKQIAVIHDLIPQTYPTHFPVGLRGRWYQLLNKWSLKNFDLIITNSQETKKRVCAFYKLPDERVHPIYPPVSPLFTPHLDIADESVRHHHPFHKDHNQSIAEFTPLSLEHVSTNPKIQKLQNFVLYVGDATWNKNLVTLAQSIKMANVPCVCVGKVFGESQAKLLSGKPDPWQRSLQSFLKLTQNDNRFIFPGYVSDLELELLYRKALMNILVSTDEGFGYSFIEAGYMSTPSILSDIPIFHETARDAALFVDPKNPQEIAQTIAKLFYDHVLHEKMSIRAFDRAQEFAPSRFQKEWFHILNTI